MLVQPRAHGVRLVTQHDHALASGTLAAAWCGPDRNSALPPTLLVACALHDGMWREEDARPSLDPEADGPLDFTRFVPERKRAFSEPFLRALEAVEPEVGRLVRLHHETLGEPVEPPRALAWLRLFDRLSLHVCLTPPGSLEAKRPSWLGPEADAPDGTRLRLAWEDEARLRVRPWPFAGSAVSLDLPFRDLPPGPWASDEELRDAWRDADVGHSTVVLVG